MNRTPVKSSQIVSIGHDPATKTLEIEFPRQSVYQYAGVSTEQAKALMDAESIGKHFGAHIKGKFEYQRMPAEPKPAN